MVGTHRRLYARDVLAFKGRRDSARRKTLDDLARTEFQQGTYDRVPLGLILTVDNEYAAVLDACVLVPMPLCDTLLVVRKDPALFRALWSEQILEEVKRTLLQKFGYTAAQVEYRLRMMREAFPRLVFLFRLRFWGQYRRFQTKRTSMS